VTSTWRVPAIEQALADRLLERADQRAEGRLREMGQRRGAREAALFGQRDEGAQLAGRDIHLHCRSTHPFFRIHEIVAAS